MTHNERKPTDRIPSLLTEPSYRASIYQELSHLYYTGAARLMSDREWQTRIDELKSSR